MNGWEETLLGELVGLARATDGNEHLITEPVTQMVAEILCTQVLSEAQYIGYRRKIDAAKREMVPDCFLCANPCGRTAAFDWRELEAESLQVRQTKRGILEKLRTLAASPRTQQMDRQLFRGLVLLGMGEYSPEELIELFTGD